MKKIIHIYLISIFAAMLALTGCSLNNSATNANSEPDIYGEVLEISDYGTLIILVDSKADAVSGQIWVTIDEDTAFVDSDGNYYTPDDANSLFEVGQTASFLSTGVILESYPMQTTALTVYTED